MLNKLLVPVFALAFAGLTTSACTDNSGNGHFNPDAKGSADGGGSGGSGGSNATDGGGADSPAAESGGSGGTGGGTVDGGGGTDLGVDLPQLDATIGG